MMLLTAIFLFTILANPSATKADCDVCPDGSNVTNVDSVIPLFKIDPELPNPTCGILQNALRSLPLPLEDCDNINSHAAGWCGCPGYEEPLNICSMCEGGAEVPDPSKVTPGGETCGDIALLATYLNETDCDGDLGETISGFAYFCDCPNAPDPPCQLCADGQEIPDPDLDVSEDFGLSENTCQESADIVTTFTERSCEASEIAIQVNGIRCGCREGEEFPACAITQNIELCTTDMLDDIEGDCECYNFCDTQVVGRFEFIGCSNFPGKSFHIVFWTACVFRMRSREIEKNISV